MNPKVHHQNANYARMMKCHYLKTKKKGGKGKQWGSVTEGHRQTSAQGNNKKKYNNNNNNNNDNINNSNNTGCIRKLAKRQQSVQSSVNKS